MNEPDANPVPEHIQRGQEFMHLYVAHERRIYGFIFTLIHDWSATEDILQETAQIMWSKFDEFKPGTNFIAWALCIARYQVMDYWKRQDSKTAFDRQLIEQLAQRAQDHIEGQEDRRHEALKRCLQKLNERDRHLVELRYAVDTTIQSIADRLGWHTKSVYRSLKRIRWQLFQCVQRTVTLEKQG